MGCVRPSARIGSARAQNSASASPAGGALAESGDDGVGYIEADRVASSSPRASLYFEGRLYC